MAEYDPVYVNDDVVWARALAPDGSPAPLRIGISREMALGKLRYVDGFSAAWSIAVGVADNGQSGSLPVMIVDIPDYPSDDTVTYVIPAVDVPAFIALLQKTARDLSAATRGYVREIERGRGAKGGRLDREIAEEIRAATRCSVDGCKRQRRFFDEQGRALCKRHAEERGVRPRGKVI